MNPLDAVRRLVTAGDREGAKRALASILRADPHNAPAWAMLAPLLQDPAQQADCYRQVLRLDPGNDEAAARLRVLTGQAPQPVTLSEAQNLPETGRTRPPESQSPPPTPEAAPNLAETRPSQGPRWTALIGLSKPAPSPEPLTPEDVIRLAGGALPPEERQRCPECDAVTRRDAAKCPWCGAPLSGQ